MPQPRSAVKRRRRLAPLASETQRRSLRRPRRKTQHKYLNYRDPIRRVDLLDHGLGPFDGRWPDTEVPGDLVAGVPLSFRHCGGVTEVRPGSLALPRAGAMAQSV